MEFVLGIAYFLFGILLAVPYCILAGWDSPNMVMVAMLAPIYVLFWIIQATLAGVIEHEHGRPRLHINWRALFKPSVRPVGSVSFLWGWTIFSFLPIIFNWTSILLKYLGYESVGSILYEHRYVSPLYVCMAILIGAVLFVAISSFIKSAKDLLMKIKHMFSREANQT